MELIYNSFVPQNIMYFYKFLENSLAKFGNFFLFFSLFTSDIISSKKRICIFLKNCAYLYIQLNLFIRLNRKFHNHYGAEKLRKKFDSLFPARENDRRREKALEERATTAP